MDMQLFIADSRIALKTEQVQKTILTLNEEFNVRSMWQDYYAEKSGLYASFEEFVKLWEEEWYKLLCPQAGIIYWTREELCNEYINYFSDETLKSRLMEQCISGYSIIWTIGKELEDATFKIVQNSPLHTMFLDVAGSLYMGIIRNLLQKYVNDKLCDGQLSVFGQHSPEIRYTNNKNTELDMRLSNILEPWQKVKSENRPRISMNKYGVMQPLKTQCNMLFVGLPQNKQINLSSIPCSNCIGKKCLYAQFGGCHLPEKNQPWLK